MNDTPTCLPGDIVIVIVMSIPALFPKTENNSLTIYVTENDLLDMNGNRMRFVSII